MPTLPVYKYGTPNKFDASPVDPDWEISQTKDDLYKLDLLMGRFVFIGRPVSEACRLVLYGWRKQDLEHFAKDILTRIGHK